MSKEKLDIILELISKKYKVFNRYLHTDIIKICSDDYFLTYYIKSNKKNKSYRDLKLIIDIWDKNNPQNCEIIRDDLINLFQNTLLKDLLLKDFDAFELPDDSYYRQTLILDFCIYS